MGSDLALSHTALRLAKKPCSVYFHARSGAVDAVPAMRFRCVRRRLLRPDTAARRFRNRGAMISWKKASARL